MGKGVQNIQRHISEWYPKGDEIIVEAESGRRMTRAARRQQPTQWTQVPVLAKIFKVIIKGVPPALVVVALVWVLKTLLPSTSSRDRPLGVPGEGFTGGH